jgi:hypothetical protein
LGIDCILNTTNNLHSFGMVDFFASTRIIIKDSYSSIKRSRNKLSSSWWIIEVCHCTNMIFMNSFSLIHFPQVESITIRIIISNRKIYWLNRIKGHAHRFIWQLNLLNWSLASQIVKDDWSINAWSWEYVGIWRIIFNF